MKKFFVMIFLVSTFFIGLSALVEHAGAKFKSDAKALELIRQARVAIGGDGNIASVRSMTITANTTHFLEKDGLAQTEQGTLEINLQLPGQYSKMVRIGNPENGGTTDLQKQVDVFVMRTDGETLSEVPSTKGKPGVFIVKDGDGKILTEDLRGGDGAERKIIIKKDDGTVIQEITPDEKGAFVFERKAGGGGADAQVFSTEDGRKIAVSKTLKSETIAGNRHNEMFRMTLALLLSAPEGLDVSYAFAGEGSVDGNVCNIVEARTEGSTFKLFLDKSTFLPRMISYDGRDFPHVIRVKKEGSGEIITENIVRTIDPADGKTVEHQLKFSDFRSVGALLLPHAWAESVGGRQTQNVDITNYEINPANIADKFKGQKVFVRQMKDQ